jgi:hypothetical protein
MFTLQEEFGNDGYAFWFKLLEHLGTKETLSMDCNDASDWRYFIAKAKVTKEKAEQILDLLAEIGSIDADLWKQKIIWSENFASRLADVYRKRGTETPSKPDFCDRNNTTADISVPESTQSKVKESKEKKSKEEKAVDKVDDKVKFADFVRLKQTEYDKLVNEYGKAATEKFIEVLNNYKGANGKTYKSDYLAILNWVVERVKKNHPTLFKKEETFEHGNPFAEYCG